MLTSTSIKNAPSQADSKRRSSGKGGALMKNGLNDFLTVKGDVINGRPERQTED
jgi:hypothetical protein